MADVFISYARVNNTDGFINRLADMLKGLGKDVWVDWEDIPHGVDYVEEFIKGLDESDTVITVLSPDYLGRPNCLRELNRAVENNKRIIPVIRLDIEFSQLPEQVRNINAIFIREADNFEAALQALIKTIDTDIAYVREHTRLLNLAQEWEKENRDSSALMRGTELQQAETWLATSAGKIPQPAELHTEFILTSRQASIARQRVILAGVSVALVVSIALSILSLLLYQQAETQREIAVTAQGEALMQAATAERRAVESQSLALAGNAQAANNVNQIQAVALALNAGSIERPPAFAQRVLSQVAYGPGVKYVFEGNEGLVTKVDFSPDGQTAVSGGELGEIIVWDVSTRHVIRRLDGMEGDVADLTFSNDGSRIFAGGTEGELMVWDAASGEIISRFGEDETHSITRITVNAEGDLLLAGDCTEFGDLYCNIGNLTLWDIDSGDELLRDEDIEGGVTGVDFSPVSNLAIVSYGGGTLTMFDMDTGEILDTWEQAHEGSEILDVVFNPGGTSFASAGEDYYVNTWSWDGETIESAEYLYGHNDQIFEVDYNSDGTRLLSASLDSSIVIWDVKQAVISQKLRPHSGGLLSATFSPDDQSVLSSGFDGLILWNDLQDGDVLSKFVGHTSGVWDVNFSPDGETAISIQWDASLALDDQDLAHGLILWDVETGNILKHFEHENSAGIEAIFSPDGAQILTVTPDGDSTLMTLWDVETGEVIHTFESSEVAVFQANFSPDGKLIASGNIDGSLSLWDIETGEVLRTFQQHEDTVVREVFTSDGARILSTSNDGAVILWDVETGEVIHTFEGHSGGVGALAISPDGKTAVTGSTDSTMILWNLDSGVPVRTFRGHTSEIIDLDFSPDGMMLASASADNRVILWDVRTAEILRIFERHSDFIYGLDFSPDGRKIISGALNGEILLWRVDPLDQLIDWTYRNRYVRELDCQERLTYNVQPACDENGIYPTRAPFATWTPMPTLTATPAP